MRLTIDPLCLLLISLAVWLNQPQREVIDYLEEENLGLREQLGNKRLRLNDDQRRRLAAKAKKLGGARASGFEDPRHARDARGLTPQADRQEI